MRIQEARDLFGYSAWANGRMFDAAAVLTPEQLSATIVSSFPSILGTLGHIVGAEWIWLRRWRGDSPTATPDWVTASSLSDLRRRLAAVEAERDVNHSTYHRGQVATQLRQAGAKPPGTDLISYVRPPR